MPVTGAELIAWGHTPGPWFKAALATAQRAEAQGADLAQLKAIVASLAPPPVEAFARRGAGELPFHSNIEAETPDETANVNMVRQHMVELMRTPTLVSGAIMPDACVSGSQPGTIPVGGVVAARDAIHPGFHSADICCSMACTILDKDQDATRLLDLGMKLSHFGGGGRAPDRLIPPSAELLERFAGNRYLSSLTDAAVQHHATQGDGNHFLFVGRVASSGRIAIVTHHGSRRPGAMLYKMGMQVAERATAEYSPDTPAHNAWIKASSPEGEAYWEALQIIRAWTKSSHFAIHDTLLEAIGTKPSHRFWNEHNFVFERGGLFYHAKGATPAYAGFASDDSGETLIPLNMAEPILIARGRDAAHGLGFAPHGAGRNYSRSAYIRQNAGRPTTDIIASETRGIDARFFCGIPDISELPGAYKPAKKVREEIERFGLAEIVDTIEPIGSIMAGDWQQDAPWRRKSKAST